MIEYRGDLRSKGPIATGRGPIAVRWPFDQRIGDLAFLAIEVPLVGDVMTAPDTPVGWTLVRGHTVDGRTTFLYSRFALSQAEAAVVVTDPDGREMKAFIAIPVEQPGLVGQS